jgi:hypothetical protein
MYEGENPSSELTPGVGASDSSSSETLATHRDIEQSDKLVASPKSQVDDPPPQYVP